MTRCFLALEALRPFFAAYLPVCPAAYLTICPPAYLPTCPISRRRS